MIAAHIKFFSPENADLLFVVFLAIADEDFSPGGSHKQQIRNFESRGWCTRVGRRTG